MASPSSSTVPHVICKGSPYEVGHEHGRVVAKLVRGSIDFYASYFKEKSNFTWAAVGPEAEKWLPYLEAQWPEYVEEMRGVAAGAGVPFSDILALNVRTEICFGLAKPLIPTDGCTSVAYHAGGPAAFLAQNWDWERAQGARIVHLSIHQAAPRAARVEMLTEAGIIGKIGLSSAGTGACMNAIMAEGVAYDRLPAHMAMRAALDADARRLEAFTGGPAARVAALLQKEGVASAVHVLVADADDAIGVEATCADVLLLPPTPTARGAVLPHANHLVLDHAVSDVARRLADSTPRMARMEALARASEAEGTVSYEAVDSWLRDESGLPYAICRQRSDAMDVATLFSIVMDLHQKTAVARIGRPTSSSETVQLDARPV